MRQAIEPYEHFADGTGHAADADARRIGHGGRHIVNGDSARGREGLCSWYAAPRRHGPDEAGAGSAAMTIVDRHYHRVSGGIRQWCR